MQPTLRLRAATELQLQFAVGQSRMDGEREARRPVADVSSADTDAATYHDGSLPFLHHASREEWHGRVANLPAPLSPVLAPLGLLGCQSAAIVAAALVVEYAERRFTGSSAFGPH